MWFGEKSATLLGWIPWHTFGRRMSHEMALLGWKTRAYFLNIFGKTKTFKSMKRKEKVSRREKEDSQFPFWDIRWRSGQAVAVGRPSWATSTQAITGLLLLLLLLFRSLSHYSLHLYTLLFSMPGYIFDSKFYSLSLTCGNLIFCISQDFLALNSFTSCVPLWDWGVLWVCLHFLFTDLNGESVL